MARRVDDVARAGGVGDALVLADARSAAAEDARALAAHLRAFDAAPYERLGLDAEAGGEDAGGEKRASTTNEKNSASDSFSKDSIAKASASASFVLDAVFRDPSRTDEAARLARRLLRLAHRAAAEDAENAKSGQKKEALGRESAGRESNAVRTPTSRPPGLRRFALASTNLERYCDALENRLLLRFEAAEREGDRDATRRCAATLGAFDGGRSLTRRFVATRAMFLDVSAVAELETLRAAAPRYGAGLETERDAAEAATRAIDALESFYAATADAAEAEANRAEEIFPDPAEALGALALRVVEQRAGAALDAVGALAAPPPPPACEFFVEGVDEEVVPSRVSAVSSRGPSLVVGPVAEEEEAPAESTSDAAHAGSNAPKHSPKNKPVGPGDPLGTPPGSPARRRNAADAARTRAQHRRGGSRSFSAGSFAEMMGSMTPSASRSSLLAEDGGGLGVPNGPGHFALLAHARLVAGAVSATRAFGERVATRAGSTRSRVAVVAAADGLLARRASPHAALEAACLRGLAADAAREEAEENGGAEEGGKGVGGGEESFSFSSPGFATLARWHAEASARCEIVLAPSRASEIALEAADPRANDSRVSGEGELSDDDREQDFEKMGDESGRRRARAPLGVPGPYGRVMPSDEDVVAAGFVPVRRTDAASDVTATDGTTDGTNETEFAARRKKITAASKKKSAKETASLSARAIANAASLAETATAERALATAYAAAAKALVARTLDRAADACERNVGRIPSSLTSTFARETVDRTCGVVFRAAGACAAGVALTLRRAASAEDAGDARDASRSAAARAGGDAAASAAYAATSATRSGREASRRAFAAFAHDASASVVDALHRGLSALFFAAEKTLRERQAKTDFCPDERAPEAWSTFPGQAPSEACAATIELLEEARRALATALAAAPVFDDGRAAPEERRRGGTTPPPIDDGQEADSGFASSPDPNVRAVGNEMASRLFDAVRAHFSRHKHSMVGALQLRRDLGEFEAWVRRNAVSEFQRERWREEAAACGALAVPAASLPRLLMEREAEAEAVGGEARAKAVVEDFVRVVRLRADYEPAMLIREQNEA